MTDFLTSTILTINISLHEKKQRFFLSDLCHCNVIYITRFQDVNIFVYNTLCYLALI